MKDLRDPKFWASASAWMVVVSIVVLWPMGIYKNWTISEIGTIIGAIAGPFAGLAGFLYIYVNFLQQNELFERQSFESGLHRLLNQLKLDAMEVLPTDPTKGKTILLKNFEREYGKRFFMYQIDSGLELQDGEKDEKLALLDSMFSASFKPSIRAILALMKSFVGVLSYIDYSVISNRENYYNLLFSQLTQAEIRTYFYGYFYKGFELTDHEKNLLKNFFNRYEGRDLIDSRDFLLIME